MKALLVGAVVLVSLAGCAGGGSTAREAAAPPPPSSAAAPDVWSEPVAPVTADHRLGTPQTCAMPFDLDVARGWALSAGDGESRDGLSARCAASADVGSMRVWVGDEPGSTPRGALERFLQGEGRIADPAYRESTVGRGTGVELTFTRPDQGGSRVRAFAVATPLHTLVVSVEGTSAASYDAALAAYVQARGSLTPIER